MNLIPLKRSRNRVASEDEEMLHLNVASALGHGPDARLILDEGGAVIKANKAAQLLAEALEDKKSDAARIIKEWSEDDYLGPVSVTVLDGQIDRRFTLHALPVLREGGSKAAILIGREPDLANHLIQAMSASRQLYKDLVGCARAFSWETDSQGRFSYIHGCEDLGYGAMELMGEYAAHVLGLDPEIARSVFSARESIEEAELWPLCKNGERACFNVSARPIFDADGIWRGNRGMARNVTLERKQADSLIKARETLAQLALSDELTGILNRRAFDDQVGVRIAHATRTGRPGVLLLIDLDHFKSVNDTLGHAAGDKVLRTFGEVLEQSLRVGDLAARIGGDEFAVWLEETDLVGARLAAERLLSHASELRKAIGQDGCSLSLSIGGASNVNVDCLDALKAIADKALYRAKNKGKACAVIEGETP